VEHSLRDVRRRRVHEATPTGTALAVETTRDPKSRVAIIRPASRDQARERTHDQRPYSTNTMRVQSRIARTSLVLLLTAVAACSDGAKTSENTAFLHDSESASTDRATAPSEVSASALSSVVQPDAQIAESRDATPAATDTPQKIDPPNVAAATREIAALERDAASALDSNDFARAAAEYSNLLVGEVASENADRAALERWAAALARAQLGHRWNARGNWPAVEVVVESGDSLIAIRRRVLAEHPGMLVCTGLIQRANQLPSDRAIRPQQKLRVPTDRPNVLVDLSAMWLLYRHGSEVVAAWEVGVGKAGNTTHTGEYTIGKKQPEPMWFPAGKAPVAFGDPVNPLGTRWLAWVTDNVESRSLGIHGTNDPTSIGKRVSQGCIRMRNEDVEALFEILPEGATVTVQP
jgi:lipoprotein-anchoring transpeptidase ErfK/SrfK